MYIDLKKIAKSQQNVTNDIYIKMLYTGKRRFRKGSLHNKNKKKGEKRHEND